MFAVYSENYFKLKSSYILYLLFSYNFVTCLCLGSLAKLMKTSTQVANIDSTPFRVSEITDPVYLTTSIMENSCQIVSSEKSLGIYIKIIIHISSVNKVFLSPIYVCDHVCDEIWAHLTVTSHHREPSNTIDIRELSLSILQLEGNLRYVKILCFFHSSQHYLVSSYSFIAKTLTGIETGV